MSDDEQRSGGTVRNADYVWDWVNTGDEVYVAEEGRTRTVSESYVVRKPDGSILCFTSRYKRGYEEALAIAAAMNTAAQSGRSLCPGCAGPCIPAGGSCFASSPCSQPL